MKTQFVITNSNKYVRTRVSIVCLIVLLERVERRSGTFVDYGVQSKTVGSFEIASRTRMFNNNNSNN